MARKNQRANPKRLRDQIERIAVHHHTLYTFTPSDVQTT